LRDTPPNRPTAPQPESPAGAKARLKTASRSYLSQGNAAIAQDWSEF
jgi:hypothetical protein